MGKRVEAHGLRARGVGGLGGERAGEWVGWKLRRLEAWIMGGLGGGRARGWENWER